MIALSDFRSLLKYGRFAMAREFAGQNNATDFNYQKNRLERLGDAMLRPIFHPTDLFFRNIRNPFVILSMTVTAIALVSIGFYPAQFFAGVYAVAPFMKLLRPEMAKFGLYLATQMIILGLGLRTLGRQNNPQLMNALRAGEIQSIQIGSVKV